MESTERDGPLYAILAGALALVLALVTVFGLMSQARAGATPGDQNPNQNFIDNNPSCSLRAEVIPGDPDHWLYIYNGNNPTKTMWLTTGPPGDLDVFVHTFTAAGQVIAKKAPFVQYPTINNWIPIGVLFQKCPPPATTTTTTTQPEVTTTTSTPDQVVRFGCPEGQIVRFHFTKVDPLADDEVTFTYIDSFGSERQFSVGPTVFDTYVFTGSGGPADGLTNTATLVSVDTDGFEFAGFSCYQQVPEETTTTSTTAQVTTTTQGSTTTTAPLVPFANGNLAGPGPVAVSPSTAELPFTGGHTEKIVGLGILVILLGATFWLTSRKVNRPVGS
jgi:hypothetical protein